MEVLFIERKLNKSVISIEKLFSTIREQLREEKVDCIVQKNPYDFSLKGMIKALLFFRRRQKKINHITGDVHWISLALKGNNTILTIHDIGGMFELSGLKKKLFFIWWLYLPIKKVKYITVISKKTKEDIVALMPWAEKKIRVIYNCHSVKENFTGEKFFTSVPEILIVGTRSNKNVDRTIDALKDIQCKLTIVGELSEPQLQLLNEFTINYDNFIQVTDDALLALYRKAHIVSFVSTFEGFGLPILEGQSQNCVIITSNIEPMLDVSGKGAVFVNPFDTESIKAGFLKIISNTELQQELIKEGRQNIKRFDVKIIAKQYIELYEEVLLNTMTPN